MNTTKRYSTRFSGLKLQHESQTIDNDDVISEVSDLNFDECDELTSTQFYSSPEYLPFVQDKTNSYFEVSEYDDQ